MPSLNKDTLKLINRPTSIPDNRKYVKTTLECTRAIVSIDFNSTTTEFSIIRSALNPSSNFMLS